jgi:hypothetical protein
MYQKTVKTVLIIGTAMALSYCSPKPYIPTSGQISYAQRTWPDADSSFLFNGYDLYKNKCGNCHYLFKPDRYTQEQWGHILSEMKTKAKLTDEEYLKIKIYLSALCGGFSSD